MAPGVQVVAAMAAVSVMLVNFAAVKGDDSTGQIQTLTCDTKPSNQKSGPSGEGGGAMELLKGKATLPGSQIKLKCPAEKHTFDPPLQPLEPSTANADGKGKVDLVYVDSKSDKVEQLQIAIPGATATTDAPTEGEVDSTVTVVTLTFPQLPDTERTIYVRCKPKANVESVDLDSGDGGKDTKVCVFAVTVTPALLQGPQSCAVSGTSVVLGIREEGETTQFSCGSGMTLSPTDEKKVYSEDCSTEERLKDMTLTPPADGSKGYYTLKAEKKPSKKTICYLCEKDGAAAAKTTEKCKVLITLRGGSQISARSVFGVALLCFLALLYLA